MQPSVQVPGLHFPFLPHAEECRCPVVVAELGLFGKHGQRVQEGDVPPVLEFTVRAEEAVELSQDPATEFPAFDHFPVADYEDTVACRAQRGAADQTCDEVGERFRHFWECFASLVIC